jgi:hypothetical protein
MKRPISTFLTAVLAAIAIAPRALATNVEELRRETLDKVALAEPAVNIDDLRRETLG